MCGGRGTRLGGEREKPLTRVGGRPMIDRVLAALAESRVKTVHAVVSPHATATRGHLADRAAERSALELVGAPGEGYVADLQYAMNAIGTGGSDGSGGPGGTAGSGGAASSIDSSVLTVAADLPLLDDEAVGAVLDAARSAGDGDSDPASLTVCVPAERKRELGVSADSAAATIDGRDVVPAGINVVGASTEGEDGDADPGAVRVTDDARFAVNVNYPSDVRIAERLLAGETTDDRAHPL
ncbi:GTP:adenosylcobinamide-phosphate guanylyltransferase [Halorubrum aidingense JCM 13560]|uniref:GTP:adenosylcobinamide-phosphate guanylyltransferase n=1 Tax=Halorubrum aidingense JCM 13560 TaxID=1230454 RepID=M0P6Y5_9EURY|nr:GTP--adenosylcobinamide-phosphate guanylyltransferase [Halorubrum aidingense]EMA65304.1 GTP:adenosylcobinamide-phosphate guanylyltransferase [Halorubrum aidingense JCM 13560]